MTRGGRERAIAFRHAQQAAVCDRAVPWRHGTAVYASDVPGFYAYNDVRLEGPDPGLSAEALADVVDDLMAGLAHRQVEVEDEAAGVRLRPGFEALGWDTERLAWMELTGPVRGAAAAPTVEIDEVPFPRTRSLREAWFLASGWMTSTDAVRRFIRLEERVGARIGLRALVAWGPAGEPVGYVAFSARGAGADIDQAYVDPDRRGTGIGGALVSAAVEAAGADSTFIVADDEEQAKHLYARLGFEPVWILHQFTRRPAAG
jgi:ribosomal protein S18 acetylase RimI-like enzyme